MEVRVFAFHLDNTTGVPPYLQLVHQVRQALLLGHLQRGDRLPLIREAVAELAINPNTVHKAYRQLEHDGLVAARPGQGTFVTAAPPTIVSPATYATVRRSLDAWLREAYAAGLDDEQITAIVSTARRELSQEGARR
jgi:GntR family transcriptional regulator